MSGVAGVWAASMDLVALVVFYRVVLCSLFAG
jgi:hypothetical protein